jgi:cold shock CspA family protein
VAQFDPQTRTGTLLLDDGQRVEFGAAAFEASGLRLLRLGQRVQVDYADGDEVARLALPTMRGQ